MPIEAFVMRYQEGEVFTEQFLSSPDFHVEALKQIVEDLRGHATGKPRSELVTYILRELRNPEKRDVANKIMKRLVCRKKDWMSVKVGTVTHIPMCEPIQRLVMSEGQEQWYGPTENPDDGGAYWYIRPVFVNHWEYNETLEKMQLLPVRWLCFARVTEESISLHWRGFSYAESKNPSSEEKNSARNSQFPFWSYVPTLFDEIENLSKAKVSFIPLHKLVLHQMWQHYMDESGYRWTHRRIRAESSGVSLNAHAGGVYDINADGILHLATTVRNAVQIELRSKYKVNLPDPGRFDEVILRTLIREYGALSYEFSLDQGGSQLFRAHCYFGQKQMDKSQDSFPHMRVFISQRSDLEQLAFLLEFLRENPHSAYTEPEQHSLF